MSNKQKKDKSKSKAKGKSARNKKSKDKSNKEPSGNETWYADGLQFECTQCGACCGGEPGYVWVNDDEIEALANEMGLELDAFEQKFVRQVGHDKSLIEHSDGDCVLLDPVTRKCTAYAARPIQCRTWPFWDSNLDKRKHWKETCQECPGAGKGRLYTFEEIEATRKQKSV